MPRNWAALTFGFLAILIFAAAPGPLKSEPRLVGKPRDPECLQALYFARFAFRSQSGLLAASKPPAALQRKMILNPNLDDQKFDLAVFDQLQVTADDGHTDTLLWQRQPQDGKRIAVLEQMPPWSRDFFLVYLLDPNISPAAFGPNGTNPSVTLPDPLNESSYPIIFREQTGPFWIVDVDEPDKVEHQWRVYRVGRVTTSPSCRIELRHWTGDPLSHLPMAVRRLARSLSRALGRDDPQDRLQSIERRRINIRKNWANAVDRPWAPASYDADAAARADKGLLVWARQSRSAAQLLARLQAEREPAARALAEYYHRKFGLNSVEAARSGRFVVADMFQSYFYFLPDQTTDAPRRASNPWIAGKR